MNTLFEEAYICYDKRKYIQYKTNKRQQKTAVIEYKNT